MPLKTGYKILRGLVRLFTPRYKTVWEEPFDGEPAVFCPNHARAWGPVSMCVSFDLRDSVRPWYNAGVLDRKGLPAYVRNDDWWDPKSRLAPLFNATVPYIVALLMPPIMRSTPGIPVYYDMRVYQTFKDSVKALEGKDHLVIFAQYPDGYQSHSQHLSRGFVMIAPMAYKRLGIRLKFYPVHVDDKKHVIRVFKPIRYDPDVPKEEMENTLLAFLEEKIYD